MPLIVLSGSCKCLYFLSDAWVTNTLSRFTHLWATSAHCIFALYTRELQVLRSSRLFASLSYKCSLRLCRWLFPVQFMAVDAPCSCDTMIVWPLSGRILGETTHLLFPSVTIASQSYNVSPFIPKSMRKYIKTNAMLPKIMVLCEETIILCFKDWRVGETTFSIREWGGLTRKICLSPHGGCHIRFLAPRFAPNRKYAFSVKLSIKSPVKTLHLH